MSGQHSLSPIPLELSELDCIELKPLLESHGIEAVVNGPSVLPNLPSRLMVPDHLVADALHIIREARLAGPEAAAEAEALGEASGDLPPDG